MTFLPPTLASSQASFQEKGLEETEKKTNKQTNKGTNEHVCCRIKRAGPPAHPGFILRTQCPAYGPCVRACGGVRGGRRWLQERTPLAAYRESVTSSMNSCLILELHAWTPPGKKIMERPQRHYMTKSDVLSRVQSVRDEQSRERSSSRRL